MVLENVPARQISRERHRSVSTVHRWCREAIDRSVVAGPELSRLPVDVDLVLIVDGLWFGNGSWVQYTMAFKPVDAAVAYFADPRLLPGGESSTHWQQIFNRIRPDVRARVRALVADGLKGMEAVAALNGWVYQRCHFHIRALLNRWLARPWVSPVDESIRWAIDDALLAVDGDRADAARAAMAAHGRDHPGVLADIIRRLLREWDSIRAYITHPGLSIPRTTGVVESMHGSLREVVSGLSTVDAIQRRMIAYVRLHDPFACNSPDFQQH
jgi:hypothetical protein